MHLDRTFFTDLDKIDHKQEKLFGERAEEMLEFQKNKSFVLKEKCSQVPNTLQCEKL